VSLPTFIASRLAGLSLPSVLPWALVAWLASLAAAGAWGRHTASVEAEGRMALCADANATSGKTIKNLQAGLAQCQDDQNKLKADLVATATERDKALAKAKAAIAARSKDIRHDPDCASWAASPVCPAAAGVRPDRR